MKVTRRELNHTKLVIADFKQLFSTLKMSSTVASVHYSCAKSPDRKYLSSNLSCNSLYLMYLEWLKEKYSDVVPVSINNTKM